MEQIIADKKKPTLFDRFDLKTEISLALIPTIMIIVVLLLLEEFSRQRLLFSSLASSAFLIYIDPRHPVNSIRTLSIAQLSAAVIGYGVYLAAGPGYLSAALAMVLAIGVMITTRAMHPPAVSSALIFAFQYTRPNTLLLFFSAVVLLVLLIVLQRISLWLIRRSELRAEQKVSGTLDHVSVDSEDAHKIY